MADIASSSSVNTNGSAATQEATQTDISTAKEGSKGISYLENLEFRGIFRMPSDDEKLRKLGFDKITDNLPDQIEFHHFTSLVKLLETYLKKFRKAVKEQASENGFYDFDALRQDVCEWRPGPGLAGHRLFAPMPVLYFDWDRQHCSRAGSSEADFHRTLMVSIIDRFDFQKIYTFTCEEQWAVRDRFLLPARRKVNRISQPKPDLAFSFDRTSIADSETADFPPELGSCLHPGKNGDERWFPFFFMEAKKGDNSLSEAFKKNLNSASQALFNIFQWMRLCPDLEEQFFKDVRVFTIDINSKDVLLRMHRAEKGSAIPLHYKFVEVAEIRNYDRIQVCHIVKTVLLDYAGMILHPILKKTFQRVSEIGVSGSIGRKRKDFVANLDVGASRRADSSQDTVIPAQQNHTGASFDTEFLSISAADNAPKRPRRGKKVDSNLE